MSRSLLSPADRYASLPTVYASACMLLTDPHDPVLLDKPNYRTYWAIPGGMVDAGEARTNASRVRSPKNSGSTSAPPRSSWRTGFLRKAPGRAS
jgi:hypothetical protein